MSDFKRAVRQRNMALRFVRLIADRHPPTSTEVAEAQQLTNKWDADLLARHAQRLSYIERNFPFLETGMRRIVLKAMQWDSCEEPSDALSHPQPCTLNVQPRTPSRYDEYDARQLVEILRSRAYKTHYKNQERTDESELFDGAANAIEQLLRRAEVGENGQGNTEGESG